ncbi:hypothetical protein CsatA_010892 [Cannabis sativa]
MPMAETVKPSDSSSEGGGGQHQKNKLDREVRDMVSAITSRLTNIHKMSSNQGHDHQNNDDEDDDDNGVRIITLAGTNTGATLRGELDDNSDTLHKGVEPPLLGESETMKTYVNSNFQAINNSIMMGGSYNTNDPGVHVEISDFGEPHESNNKPEYKRGWKGKKKSKEALKSDHKSSSSD